MTTKQKAATKNWDFFESVITYNALTDGVYLASIIDVTDPKYFKTKEIQDIFVIIRDFYTRRNTVPTTTEIKTYLTTPELTKSFLKVVESFKQIDTKGNKDELYQNTEQFLKERAVYEAVVHTVDQYGKPGNVVDAAKTFDLFSKACNISLTDNLGHEYFEDIFEHIKDLQTVNSYISSGYKWLDVKMGGGFLATGRALYIFSGTTNSGKSIVLANLSGNITAQDKVVIIISLEMPEQIYARRVSSQLSKIPLFQLQNEVENLNTFVNTYRRTHKNAKLYIKEYPPKGVTANHIKAYIEKLMKKKNIKPDAIVIDYLNLVAPTSPTGNTYIDVKAVSEQIRALSYYFKAPVITATQLNRSAMQQADPGLETTSESMGTSMTADFQASIWADDADKELGIIHMGIQKNRLGPNFGQHAFRIDWDSLAIDETDDDLAENKDVNRAENTLERLLG